MAFSKGPFEFMCKMMEETMLETTNEATNMADLKGGPRDHETSEFGQNSSFVGSKKRRKHTKKWFLQLHQMAFVVVFFGHLTS